MPEDQLMTVAEVAARLRVNPESVRRWVRQGRLAGVRVGGTKAGYRIRQSDVERFLSQPEAGQDQA